MSVMPETIVENCPQQISKVKGGFIMQISKEMLILELLADGKRMPSAELEKAVNECGISSRTMRTAKSRIGDRLVTEKDGTAWVCYLRD